MQLLYAAPMAESGSTPRMPKGGTETSSPSQEKSVWRDSTWVPHSKPPHMLHKGGAEDSAWYPRCHPKTAQGGAVSPEWMVAGSERRMAGRGAKTPEFSPCGVAPLRLEGRFNALDTDLEAATPSPCHAMAADASLNRAIEIDQSQGTALLGTGEGTILDRECFDSPRALWASSGPSLAFWELVEVEKTTPS